MGANPARDAVVTAYDKSLIRFKAGQLSRKPGFRGSDQEDLEQELLLHLLEKAHLFDPERGATSTFADRAVKSRVSEIIRDRKRMKRAGGFAAQSLDATPAIPGGVAESIANSLAFGDLMRRTGSTPRDPLQDRATSEALTHAIANMPDELRDFCQRLRTSPEAEIARDLRVSRRQVRNMRDRVREYLVRAGLGDS